MTAHKGIFVGCLGTLFLAGCMASDPATAPVYPAPNECTASAVQDSNLLPLTQALPTQGGILRIRLTEEPRSLLSLIDPSPAVQAIADHDMFETLVHSVGESDAVVPELATSWQVSAQFDEFVFHLHPQAKWHDGKNVTADDVVYTFLKVLDPDEQIPLGHKLTFIRQVLATDKDTVTISLDRPYPDFLRIISAIPILPAHIFGNGPLIHHTGIRSPIGSGPFRFVSWQPGESIIIERNPSWRATSPYFDRIEYRIVHDHRIAMAMHQRGDLDITPDLPPDVRRPPDQQFTTYPSATTDGIVYNMQHPLFAPTANRMAVAKGLHLAGIQQALFHCFAGIARSPWMATDALFSDTFSPNNARDILQKAGWKNNGSGPLRRGTETFSFTLLQTDQDRDRQRLGAILQGNLREFGIYMNISTVSQHAYLSRLASQHFEAALVTYESAATFDPFDILHSSAIGVGKNYGGYKNETVDRTIEALSLATDEQSRLRLRTQIARLIHADEPITFLFRPSRLLLAKPNIRGIHVSAGQLDKRSLWRLPEKAVSK